MTCKSLPNTVVVACFHHISNALKYCPPLEFSGISQTQQKICITLLSHYVAFVLSVTCKLIVIWNYGILNSYGTAQV